MSWSHDHMSQKDIEGSRTIMSFHMLIVKIEDYRLSFFFIFFSHFIFFDLFFHFFSIFRTLGLEVEVISHTVTSVTSDSMVTVLITGLKKRK